MRKYSGKLSRRKGLFWLTVQGATFRVEKPPEAAGHMTLTIGETQSNENMHTRALLATTASNSSSSPEHGMFLKIMIGML